MDTIDTGTPMAPAPAWDLDQWLNNSRPPERSVRVIGRGDLLAEYEELERQLTDAKAAGNGMLVGRAGERRIAQRMTAVREQMRASAIDLRFRALVAEEQDDVDAACARKDDGSIDGSDRAARMVAAACVSHELSVEQAHVMRVRIGEGQFLSCWRAVHDATNERTVDVPFSSAHYAEEMNAES
jgi:hypothetical protein